MYAQTKQQNKILGYHASMVMPAQWKAQTFVYLFHLWHSRMKQCKYNFLLKEIKTNSN